VHDLLVKSQAHSPFGLVTGYFCAIKFADSLVDPIHLLKYSFLHLQGFTVDDEEDLWASGVRNWDDALASDGLTSEQREALEQSAVALTDRNAVYFGDLYRAGERWRLLPDFENETAFLDIETTGLGGDSYLTSAEFLMHPDLRHTSEVTISINWSRIFIITNW